MHPQVRITANGQPLALGDRLQSLEITDEAGVFADTLSLTVTNPHGTIALPDTSATLSVMIGYANKLLPMGIFAVDEITEHYPPRTLTISARAATMHAGFKTTRNQSYSDTTLGDVIKAIAGRHQLKPQVAKDLQGVAIKHLDQSFESDLALLARLAEAHGATAKPAGGSLVFVPKSTGTKADGTPIDPVAIDLAAPGRIKAWSLKVQDREHWASVQAHWLEGYSQKTQKFVKAGSGEPMLSLRKGHKTQGEAQAAAAAKYAAAQRGRKTLSITLIGSPDFCAETPIDISGIGSHGNGRWIVTKARHSVAQGYITTLDAQRPGALTTQN